MDSVAPSLAAALDSLAQHEREFAAGHGRYATNVRTAGWVAADPSVRVMVLSADSSGWSAMAVSTRVPDFVCVAAAGTALTPVVVDSATDRSVCGRPGGAFAHRTSLASDTTSLYRSVDRPPEEHCPPLQLTAAGRTMVKQQETVWLEFVLDSLGRPEPSYLSIRGGDDWNGPGLALEGLSHCAFSPGSVAGHPVRVMLQVPLVLAR